MRLILFLFTALFLHAFPLSAQTFLLKEGSTITAPVIKETPATWFLDLDYDILALPKSAVESVEAAAGNPNIPKRPINTLEHPKSSDGIGYISRDSDVVSTAEGVSLNGPCVVVVKTPAGAGSGFLVNSNGYLITNFHVIHKQTHISITRFVSNGPELKRLIYNDIRIVALDSFHDLALLKIEPEQEETFPAINLSPDEHPVLGEKVFVIGNPLGLERTVTEGVLSHTGRLFGGNLYLQIDASVNPGNSGGPLFNDKGQVIGVVNMGIAAMQGLNFAIPVRHVKFLLDNVVFFAYDQSNSESGFIYLTPPGKPKQTTTMKENQ